MDRKRLNEIVDLFDVAANISPYGNGHINDTYLCGGDGSGYILQRINTDVFKNPDEVMENIVRVTEFLRGKIAAAGGDPERETLTVIPTKKGESFLRADDGCYRMYTFVQNTYSADTVENNGQLFEAGKAFGSFQKMLNDFPMEGLHETIVNFHVTPERVKQLDAALKVNFENRAEKCADEIALAKKYSSYADKIVEAIRAGEIPLRVTHNDTKLNNVLLDRTTGKGVCVIDLDTVMPGSLLYDYGDALRFGASSGSEDEKDLSKIYFDLDKFRAFSEGFLGEVGSCLTAKEREYLPLSALMMTYECGIRFLADYLNGDTYFKIHRPGHNLDRARTQLKLVCDIESKFDEMKRIVDSILD